MKTLVKVIVADGRPRVTPLNGSGFVRFPKNLRVVGAVYEVELKAGPAGSWIAVNQEDLRRVA